MMGCAGSPDDLRHYILCERLWLPNYRALRMTASPSWAQHAALEGDTLQRVAAMRARVAAFHTYMIVRRGDGAALGAVVVAAVDHARAHPHENGAAAPVL